MALKDTLEVARKELTNQAGTALDNLAALANDLEMKDITTRMKGMSQALREETFNLIVAGRFKNGKSTLMNALLGRPTRPIAGLGDGHGPMPVDDLPCTATLTLIRYAEQPYVRMHRFDKKQEDWSLERYLREAVVREDNEETREFFKDIRHFEVGFPAELCKSGVTLFDSPGLDDVPERDVVTHQAVERSDAAIVLFNSISPIGDSECKFVRLVVSGTGTRAFTVMNVWEGRQIDERLKAYIWNRLVKDERGGPGYAGQDLTSQDIYLVNALRAQQGKLTNNARLVEESGLALLEQRLGSFLIKERYRVHLQKYTYTGDIAAASIEQHITQRRAALMQDEQKLQQAYEVIQPQLVEIRARREKLPMIFVHHCKECQRELKASFELMVARLRQDLPAELKQRPLPSMKRGVPSIVEVFQQKRLCQDALELCNKIVTEHMETWSRTELPKILSPRLESLLGEISDEVATIGRNYDAVHFQLTGWTASAQAPTSLLTTRERVISALAGLFVGDFTCLIGPAGGGYRSLAGALAGNIAAHIILGALGLSGGLLFFPALIAAMLTSLVVAGQGLEDRIKATTLIVVDPELQKLPSQTADVIDQNVAQQFARIEAEVMKQVLAVIEEEEQNIKKMMELNQRSRAEKAQSLALLDATGRKVASQRQLLKDVQVKVEQVA